MGPHPRCVSALSDGPVRRSSLLHRAEGTARTSRVSLFLVLLLAVAFLPEGPAVRAQAPEEVLLLDSLRFDPGVIVVEPGENVSMRIVNVGVAQHTFTLFAEPNVQLDYSNMATLTAYYEENEKLADIWLAGGESGWANFTAPLAEANYAIVCMIIGHAAAGMVGTLVVGEPAPTGFSWPLGLVQTIFVTALMGTAVFAAYYHLAVTRR